MIIMNYPIPTLGIPTLGIFHLPNIGTKQDHHCVFHTYMSICPMGIDSP
jgi:hypothetical protein